MTRDMDFIRELLLKIESGQRVFETTEAEVAELLGINAGSALTKVEAEKLRYHLRLLNESGFLMDGSRDYGSAFDIEGLTWQAHDFLDSVRDSEIWRRTKEGAINAGGFTVKLLSDIAVGFIRKQIRDKTGVDI